MRAQFLAGVYRLGDPRAVVLAVSLALAVMALAGALFPAHAGLLADPISGGGCNG